MINFKNSVFDYSGLILTSINLASSEVLDISHVTHTPISTAQKENILMLGTIMVKMSHFVTIAAQLAFLRPNYSRLGQYNNYYTLKGMDRVVIRQYFVNFVTLRIWYLFSTVRCPQKTFQFII